jgi:hypothetical protein
VLRSPNEAATGVAILSGFRSKLLDTITTRIIIVPRIAEASDAVAMLEAHNIEAVA